MIKLVVNGKTRELEGSQDLVSFLESFGVNIQHIAVGYNGTVLEKDRFSETMLQDGDVLEVVRPVGGG